MAASNFTPIILYHTTTASAAPTAGNLNNGELAINITDGKLFYKDNGGTVQVIATKGTGTIGGSNTQVQYNSSGALAGSSNFTFNGTTATINTLNLTNALGTAYGGTALTTYTQGDLVYASAANTLAKLGIGANTYILTSTGSVPQWSAPSAITVSTATNLAGGAAGSVPYQSGASTTTFLSIGTAGQVLTSSGSAPQWSNLSSLGVTSLSFGTTGLTPSTATQGAITVAGTLATTNGGTGLTSFTANQVFYASSTSAVGQSANLTFDGTTLTAANFTDSSLTSGRVTYATTGGNLTDSANLLYSGTDLTVYGITVGRGAGAVASNTAVGASALAANTTGINNTAIGFQAGGFFTTTSNNVALGWQAMASATGSSSIGIGRRALLNHSSNLTGNTAVGYEAGRDTTTGGVTAFGTFALAFNTTGIANTAVGNTVLESNTTGSNNAALGDLALRLNTTGGNNTALGTSALQSNTTASNNTAVGYQAGYSNTTGTQVTAIGTQAAYSGNADRTVAVGYQALYTNTGDRNTALGWTAMAANTSGAYNVGLGHETLRNNTTASNAVAVGYNALRLNTTGESNSGVGAYALTSNTTGANNTALGNSALASNTTAAANTAVGYQAGYSTTTGEVSAFGSSALRGNTTGVGNAAFGMNVLYSNTTGSGNTAFGNQHSGITNATMFSNTTGGNNSAFGIGALRDNTTGSSNTAVGYFALLNNTASENTAVGNAAMQSNTSGTYNVAVGKSAGSGNGTGSSNISIGWNANRTGTGSGNTMVGTASGYDMTTGAANTALGDTALRYLSSGASNVAVGSGALTTLTTGSQTTAIGYQALYYSNTASNNTAVGYRSGYNSTGAYNTFVGVLNSAADSCGGLITTGAKNTILGGYSGNQGGLDIRTASNYIVLSDGDGNPRIVVDGGGFGGIGVNPANQYAANGGASWQIGRSTNIWNYSISGNDQTRIYNNAYLDTAAAERYLNTNRASKVQLADGRFFVQSAGSGSAGALATFTSVLDVSLGETLALQGATSQTGAGITFPATQNASSNANTLDDYEEGTWTCTMVGSSGGSVSLGTGYYVKVGQVVYCYFDSFGVSTSGLSGNIGIQGLPFTSYSSVSQSSYMFPTGANNTPCLFYVESNTTNVTLYKAASGSSSVTNFTVSDFVTSTPSMRHSFVYRTNS